MASIIFMLVLVAIVWLVLWLILRDDSKKDPSGLVSDEQIQSARKRMIEDEDTKR